MPIVDLLRTMRRPLTAARAGIKRRAFRRLARVDEGSYIGPNALASNPSGDPGRVSIGRNASILGRLYVQGDGRIDIGDYTTVRYGSVIQAVESVEIGSHVIISHDVVIQDNNNHPTSPRARHELSESKFAPELNAWTQSASAPIVIEDHVWIGLRAVVLKGVRIGRGSIVGACAVVTKNIPAFSVVAGNPARVVKQLPNDLGQ